ncbi:N-acetylglucosamine-6-phosphate deacetylase [Aerosakkonemataceae cyanobacterium BLCC-F154]|uniref:N-acetylglucosamine-6-phosphate deacetylase n=1 Tax=Floridaenema fluviatile BLCC-F154 TaxID=3153640 RepID=A0ABV4YLW1_9CYAN
MQQKEQMISQVQIINVRFPGYKGLQKILLDSQGTITKIQQMGVVNSRNSATNPQIIDVSGDWVSLGGVDLQINGALGLAFPELNQENCDKLSAICDFLWQQGVASFLPTLVTTSLENFHRSLAILADFISSQSQTKPTAKIIGVHLEGPFLNPEKRGAHPAEYLLPLTIDNVQRVLGDYANIVKVITLAPELDPTEEAISYLKELGIIISLGHSQATFHQGEKAFNLGASMVTHAFNAMPSLHHREPGLLAAAIVNSQVKCGLIADGKHVSVPMMQILLRASDYDKGTFLVSDALSPLGLPDGVYSWDVREIEVINGTAKLPDGTLAGTTLPLLSGVQNLVRWGICEVEKAIALATISPRKAMGIKGIIGESGSQLLRWSSSQSPITKETLLSWQRLLT